MQSYQAVSPPESKTSSSDSQVLASDRKQLPIVTVGALVTAEDNRVLIVKTTKWRGTWGVPGGKVDWGESLEMGLMRELREEVGLDLTDIRLAVLQESVIDPQFCREAHFILVNYYARSSSQQVVPNEEILEWRWVTPKNALYYPLNSYTRLLIENYLREL
jgi:nucleoside triphosphatase